jgi:hypothetical protein
LRQNKSGEFLSWEDYNKNWLNTHLGAEFADDDIPTGVGDCDVRWIEEDAAGHVLYLRSIHDAPKYDCYTEEDPISEKPLEPEAWRNVQSDAAYQEQDHRRTLT